MQSAHRHPLAPLATRRFSASTSAKRTRKAAIATRQDAKGHCATDPPDNAKNINRGGGTHIFNLFEMLGDGPTPT